MRKFKISVNAKEIICKKNETLLNASIRQFGGIFVGCKGGGCGLCKVKVNSGDSEDGIWSKSVLCEEEYQQGYRLACQIKPTSNMQIETCREANKVLK